MSIPIHNIGSSKRVKATFRDITGALGDPTTVTFKMRLPDNTLTTYLYGTNPEVVKESLGVFYVDWSFDVGGYHRAKFEGTGTIEAASQYECYARSNI